MKIKCPDCNEEFNNMIEFGVHCREYPETSLTRYAILVTKIHKKIEECDNLPDFVDHTVFRENNNLKKELKSLLENEK